MSASLSDRASAGALPAPSPEALAACRNLTWTAITDVAELAESYARSLAEASWRADPATTEVHIRQLRACVVEAAGLYRELFPKPDGGGQ